MRACVRVCVSLGFLCAFVEGPFLCVLEYAENGSLAERTRDKHFGVSVPWVESDNTVTRCEFALAVAKAMKYLHSQNPPILHRDLKCDNILVGSAWNCKVAGACCACSSVRMQHVFEYTLFGSVPFIPPQTLVSRVKITTNRR